MRHPLRFTHHGDHHVGLLRGVNRFVDHLFRRAWIHLHRFLVLVEEGHDVFIVGDVCAFGVNHFCIITHSALNACQHGNGLIRHACGGPAAHDVTLAVGQRTDHGNGAGFFQRQRVETVFQQHQAFARHFAGFFAVQAAFSIGVCRVRLLRPQMAVRIVKQPHVIFHVQHVASGIVQLRHRHLAALHQPRQVFAVVLVAHAHVDAGLERHAYRIFRVRRCAVLDQLFNRPVIRNGDALEAPLVAQHIFQQPRIGGGRRAVERVQRHHHRAAACVQPRFVRRHIVVKQALRTHVHGVVLFAAFHRAIGGEVLDAGHHRVTICRTFALHRFHHGFAHRGG